MCKTVIITGASSGIGQACALEYGKRGFNVVFTGRNPERMEQTKTILEEKQIDCLAISVDAASKEGADEVIGQALAKYGSIDTLICNAGISMRALFKDIDLDVFKKVMDINFMVKSQNPNVPLFKRL